MNNSYTSWLRVFSIPPVVTVVLVLLVYLDSHEPRPDPTSVSQVRPQSTVTWLQDDPSSEGSPASESERLKSDSHEVSSGERTTLKVGEPGPDATRSAGDPRSDDGEIRADRKSAAISTTLAQQASSTGI